MGNFFRYSVLSQHLPLTISTTPIHSTSSPEFVFLEVQEFSFLQEEKKFRQYPWTVTATKPVSLWGTVVQITPIRVHVR